MCDGQVQLKETRPPRVPSEYPRSWSEKLGLPFIDLHVTGGPIYLDPWDYFFLAIFVVGIAVLGLETRGKLKTHHIASMGWIALSFSGLVYSFILAPTLSQSAPPSNAVYVDMLPQSFSPSTIRVVLGVNNTVAWRNMDTVPHGPHDNSNQFLLQANPGQVKWWISQDLESTITTAIFIRQPREKLSS